MGPLSEVIDEIIPGWMKKKPFEHWTQLAFVTAAMFDALVDSFHDGRLAGMPGQVDLPGIPTMGGFESIDALPFIGRDRRIVEGQTENPADYAERLRKFRTLWRKAGTAKGLLIQLQSILGPNPPLVRLVTTHGTWYTLVPDGTFIINWVNGKGLQYNPNGTVEVLAYAEAHPWDWDSTTKPAPDDIDDPFRIWAIIYLPTNAPLTATEGKWGDGTTRYGDYDKCTGTSGTVSHTELLRGLANDWRTAGVKLSHFILTFDPASFDPLLAYPDPGLPDGYWGQHGKIATFFGGAQKWVRSRNPRARYVRGVAGIGY